MKNEIWKDIKGYEGFYQISSEKRIKSLKRYSSRNTLLQEKILKPRNNNGYFTIWLSKESQKKLYYINRIYYETFEKGE